VILPAGISFYTFQAVSYSVDVYRKKTEATRDILAFFAFISFFPQLVAGPIERATNLLPQFLRKREFDQQQATDGMRQFLWGLFKKTVVADNCALHVSSVFYWSSRTVIPGSDLLLAAVLFSFQIYADFSGYSDMAIGTSKLFGVKLMQNFKFPYFSRDMAEFWRRWHISLTTWFRDYVYIPLGGSRPEVPAHIQNPDRYKKWIIVRNTFVIFLLSGFWHGANWTFIAWGAYHALLFLPLILFGKNRKYTNQVAEGRLLPTWKECGQMLLTFALVVLGLIVFRAPTISQAWEYIGGICNYSLISLPWVESAKTILPIPIVLINLILFEWFNRQKSHGLAIQSFPMLLRWGIYGYLCMLILAFGAQPETFIYFQF
jgi:D-alanyl-lipoteichoic acid acyltransferase DltB (MBOAT superfamily)